MNLLNIKKVPDSIGMDSALGKFNVLCKYIFINLHDDEDESSNAFLKKIGFLVILLNYFAYAILNFPIYGKSSTVESVLWQNSLGTGILLTFTLYLSIYLKRIKIRKIFDLLIALQKESAEKMKKLGYDQKLQKFIRLQSFLQKYCITSGTFSLLQLLYDPLFNGNKSNTLPFDVTIIGILPFVVLWQWIVIIMCSITWSVNFTIITISIEVLCIEFGIFKYEIRELMESESVTQNQLKGLIIRHLKLIECAEKLEDIFAPIFLPFFIFSSLIICFVFIQLMIASNSATFIVNCCFLGGSMFTLFSLCYFGQRIKDASENIAEEIYNCGWEKIEDKELKSSLLIMMMRAQKPTILTNWKFSTVCLEHFTKVCFSAYSYVTLFRKLYMKG